jgi:hypothetical protein
MSDKDEKSYLTLGWEVTKNLEPRYWVRSEDPKPGSQADHDLVRIPAELMASHTAIIAQSGSGKSFFLGRLVEEILINTRAHCVIFDPNGDFRRVDEVEPEELWRIAEYDPPKKYKLPHEKSRDKFLGQWSSLDIRLYTQDGHTLMTFSEDTSGHTCSLFEIDWTNLEVDFFCARC